jgi:hypothetical protein
MQKVRENSDWAHWMGGGKAGRGVALKALRKGESAERVAARLVESGHGHWTVAELEELRKEDAAQQPSSGGCWQACVASVTDCFKCCRKGGKGVYTLVTNGEAPLSV